MEGAFHAPHGSDSQLCNFSSQAGYLAFGKSGPKAWAPGLLSLISGPSLWAVVSLRISSVRLPLEGAQYCSPDHK